jgi:hypothetical protein
VIGDGCIDSVVVEPIASAGFGFGVAVDEIVAETQESSGSYLSRAQCEERDRMAAMRSRRRSLFDSDEEAELVPSVENPPLGAALSASTSSASLQAGNNNEDSEAQAEQTRQRKLEQRNSRSLFSDDEEEEDEEEEDEPERPRASSRKPGAKCPCGGN